MNSLWRFDTTSAPNGSYGDFGDKPGFARAGMTAVPLGSDTFLITGTPAAELSGAAGSLTARTDIASLPTGGASVIATDGRWDSRPLPLLVARRDGGRWRRAVGFAAPALGR